MLGFVNILIFCIYWGDCMISIICLVDVVCHVGLKILSHPCIHGINPTWSWYMVLLMYCWIQLPNILLRIFASMLIKDIGLYFFFPLVGFLFGFSIWIMRPHGMSLEVCSLLTFWNNLRSLYFNSSLNVW